MNIYCKKVFTSYSPEDTNEFSCSIGLTLVPRTVIMITGDLGSGKTTFVKGLAQGIEVKDTQYVNSPTYSMVNQYNGRFTFYHVDLYRLNRHLNLDQEDDDIGLGEIFDSESVVAVEWSEKINFGSFLPATCLEVKITIIDEFIRQIEINSYGSDSKL